jgi:hypothetical protein
MRAASCLPLAALAGSRFTMAAVCISGRNANKGARGWAHLGCFGIPGLRPQLAVAIASIASDIRITRPAEAAQNSPNAA